MQASTASSKWNQLSGVKRNRAVGMRPRAAASFIAAASVCSASALSVTSLVSSCSGAVMLVELLDGVRHLFELGLLYDADDLVIVLDDLRIGAVDHFGDG